MEDTYNIQLSRKCYYVCLGISAVSIIAYLILCGLGISLTELNPYPCVLYSVLGIYCPGCGGTRSVESLLHGDFLQSLIYHPVVPYTAILLICYMSSHTLNILSKGRVKAMLFRGIYLFVMLAIIVIQCIVKNVLKLVFLIEIC